MNLKSTDFAFPPRRQLNKKLDLYCEREDGLSHSLRLILVDDDMHLRRLMSLLLADDFEIEVAANVTDAMALIGAQDFDVVLCDLTMPDGGAPVLHRHLQRQQHPLARRFIVASGGVFCEAGEKFMAASGAPLLLKPFGAEDVRSIVTSVLTELRHTA